MTRLFTILFLLLNALATVCHARPEVEDLVLSNYNFHSFAPDGQAINHVVHDALIDSKGRLWAAHEGGLSLFDGHSLKEYSAVDPASGIEGGFFRSVKEAGDGTIWLGNWGSGLYRFNEATYKPERVQLPDSEAHKQFDGKIWTLSVDDQGRVWIGTFTSGLYVFDPRDRSFVQVWKNMLADGPSHHRVDGTAIDGSGKVYFATNISGTYVIEAPGEEPALVYSCSDNGFGNARDVVADPSGRVLIVCAAAVLLRSADGTEIRRVDYHPTETSDSFMSAFFMKSENAALLATGSGTLHRVDFETGKTTMLAEGSSASRIPPSTIIWNLNESHDGTLVIATANGIYLSQPADRRYSLIMKHGTHADMSLGESRGVWVSGHRVVFNDRNYVYVGTLDDPDTLPSRFSARRYELPVEVDARGNDALVTSTGQIIYTSERGMFHSGPTGEGELEVYKPTDGKNASLAMEIPTSNGPALLTNTSGDKVATIPLPLHSGRVATVIPGQPDNNGARLGWRIGDDIWLSGFNLLTRYSIPEERFLETFAPDADVPDSIRSPFGTGMIRTADDQLIFGTNNGAYYLDLDAQGRIAHARNVFETDGLKRAAVIALFRIDEKNLLVYCQTGPVHLDLETGTHTMLFEEEGGFSQVRTTLGRYDQDPKTGLAIMSGANGPVIVNPHKLFGPIREKPLEIVAIESFRDNQLVKWPAEKDALVFNHEDRVIRFRFGALDLVAPGTNRYSIRLLGFDDQWIDLGNLREFSFTNLDAGKYTLEVRTHEFIRPEASTVKLDFEVLPPWWETWWAYTLYALVIVGSLLGYFLNLRRKLAREREISARLREADTLKSEFLSELEIKVDEATSELRHAVEALEIKNVELEVAQHRAQDASRLKSEFLANMSHEIRTPMNGVLGFTQLLRKSTLDTDQHEYVETIESSAHSLLGIINDILDLSKIEAGKLIIDNTGFNLHVCATETMETLAPVAYDKGLELTLEISSELPTGLRGDPVRLRQVITNLVGNAIKFTPDGGVTVTIRPARLNGNDSLEIRVSDTGRGITAQDKEKLFSAFERGNANLSSSVAGTGLGLVITKKLAEAMGGEISLDSEFGIGTTVTVKLPLRPDLNPENRYESARPLLGKSVYLVDPHTDSRAALHEFLQHQGASVVAVAEIDRHALDNMDIVAVGIDRKQSADPESVLQDIRQRIGNDLPVFCFISRMDRSDFRRLGETFNALCLPKISQVRASTRRIEDWLRGDTRHVDTTPGTDALPKSLKGLTAVIADDNRINRYFLRKMLESHGAVVHEATNGREALELLLSDDIDSDIALIDLHMPELDGLDVAERARARGVTFPMLVVSANVLQETRQAATAAGFDDYIMKPVEEDALLDAVHRHCRP